MKTLLLIWLIFPNGSRLGPEIFAEFSEPWFPKMRCQAALEAAGFIDGQPGYMPQFDIEAELKCVTVQPGQLEVDHESQ